MKETAYSKTLRWAKMKCLENAKDNMAEELAMFASLINLRRVKIIFITISFFISFDTNMYKTNGRIILRLVLIGICLWRFVLCVKLSVICVSAIQMEEKNRKPSL